MFQNKKYNTKTKYSKNKKSQRTMLTWKLANKAITILAVFSFVYFVICVNNIATKGFMIKDLKIRVQQISKENQKIELQASELKTLTSINARANSLKMVKVDKIDYLTVMDDTVALK
jgi:hypothetical protein